MWFVLAWGGGKNCCSFQVVHRSTKNVFQFSFFPRTDQQKQDSATSWCNHHYDQWPDLNRKCLNFEIKKLLFTYFCSNCFTLVFVGIPVSVMPLPSSWCSLTSVDKKKTKKKHLYMHALDVTANRQSTFGRTSRLIRTIRLRVKTGRLGTILDVKVA